MWSLFLFKLPHKSIHILIIKWNKHLIHQFHSSLVFPDGPWSGLFYIFVASLFPLWVCLVVGVRSYSGLAFCLTLLYLCFFYLNEITCSSPVLFMKNINMCFLEADNI